MEVQMRHLLLLVQCCGPNGRDIIVYLLKGDPSWQSLLLQIGQYRKLFALEPCPAKQLFIKGGQFIRIIGIQDSIPSHKF